MTRFNFIICIALFFVVQNSFAQTDSSFLKKAVSSAETYLAANPVEKVYLHLDRYAYLPGDTVWFKAYTVAGTDHGLSAISSILHVEFLNGKDSMVRRMAVLLGSGLGRGDIPIAANLQPGKYHIRAYTNWMRNAAPDYFYDQPVTVTALQSTAPNKPAKIPAGIDVQFFPEGGSLIAGLRVKVAVKATNKSGLGETVSGSVVDNDGNEVAVFSSQQLGMASFILTAQPGKRYSAVITTKNNEKLTKVLPDVDDDGFSLAVYNNEADSIGIKVTASEKLFTANKNASYYLLGQSVGKVLYATGFNLSAHSFAGRIDKKRFPTGIVQFTLFAKTGEALNERIVFIQHDEDKVRLSITGTKSVYNTRQPVSLAIKASNAVGEPLAGSFSASVISEELNGPEDAGAGNIYSGLLLTSEIKGYVENPGYYFTNINDKTRAGLDLLMLTQGYRRFTWKEVIDNSFRATDFQPENSLDISGHVVVQQGSKPVAFPKIKLLSARGGSAFGADTVGTSDGKFIIKRLFPDSVMPYKIKATTSRGDDYVTVLLDTLAGFKEWKEPAYRSNLPDTVTLSPYQKQVMQQLRIRLDRRVISLKEVTITSQRKSSTPPSYADQVLTNFPEDGGGVPLLSRYLSSKLTAVTFQVKSDGTFALYSPLGLRTDPPTSMNFILDGFRIDATIFSTLNVNDIESVEVLRSRGNRDIVTGLSDVVIIKSKSGPRPKPATPNEVAFRSYGVYQEKEFYSPVYNTESIKNNTPDLRATIYWKADVITDKDGNASISFYNADTKGTYRVTLEGIDTEGKLGRQVYTYKVE